VYLFIWIIISIKLKTSRKYLSSKKTTKEFISEAIAIHGDRYDYSLVEYISRKHKVKIICKTHGVFKQSAGGHIEGQNCPNCAYNKKTTKEFISEAIAIHGDRYDYSLVEYKKLNEKVKIICKEHGVFEQIPKSHLNGNQCLKCSGNEKKTLQVFIKDAQKIHGKKYDYSSVNYYNTRTKITIICPIHGKFSQVPYSHLIGKGCIQCGFNQISKSKTRTTEDFIELAQMVHGELFDYSLVNYQNGLKKVKIICKEHGVFEQIPKSHLKGRGCPTCTGYERKTTELFIRDARKTHGDKYDYSLIDYQPSEKVKIICKEHGVFEQNPFDHIRGRGCWTCSGSEQKTTELFIKESKKIHGDKYDYSLVDYKNSTKKVKIICLKHGLYMQTPAEHLSGRGCRSCGIESGIEKLSLSKNQFIDLAIKVHGDKYDYSLVDYKNRTKKVKIICKEHGVFEQIAGGHLNGSGCPSCAMPGFDPKKPSILYYVKIKGTNIYKIGITNYSVRERFHGDFHKLEVIKTFYYKDGRECYEMEQKLHKDYAGDQYTGPSLLKTGNTELFVGDVLKLNI